VQAILTHDNVILLVDTDSRKFYEGRVPKDVLLTADVHDIWMRDFTTVNPHSPMQFTYTWASMTKSESKDVQNSFSRFADKYGIERQKTDYLLDGGNIVDNYKGKIITTTRFLDDNYLEYGEAVKILKQLTGAKEVAIIEPDDDILAHSDGMVSFIDDNTLAINDMSDNPKLKEKVWKELKSAFPTAKLIEVPVDYKDNPKGQFDDFASACGINLNAVMTNNYLYVPVFNMAHEKETLALIAKNTTKKIITVDAKGVCHMGGSVRCLTWQVTGENAKKLIEAARKSMLK
jgi:agmatine/peptidylarginine deiminase